MHMTPMHYLEVETCPSRVPIVVPQSITIVIMRIMELEAVVVVVLILVTIIIREMVLQCRPRVD